MRHSSKLAEFARTEPGRLLSLLISPVVLDLVDLPAQPSPQAEEEADDILSLTFQGSRGHILMRNDGVRVLIEGFRGDRPVLRCAVRDRKLDASTETSPLTFYPNTDPACNRLPGPDFQAAELSVYSWSPRTYLTGLDIVGTVGHFIADPDYYIWHHFNPQIFFKLWEQVFFLGRAPWQTATPMQGVAEFFVERSTKLLTELGYHRIDGVPSWFNVARFFDRLGFNFTYGEHERAYDALVQGLKCFLTLDHAQQSWLVALQNIPEAYIPDKLRLPARWPVTHTNHYWVRMHKDLNPYAMPTPAYSELTELVINMRHCDEPAPHVQNAELETADKYPCTSTLGESSPAVSGPSATDINQTDPSSDTGSKQYDDSQIQVLVADDPPEGNC